MLRLCCLLLGCLTATACAFQGSAVGSDAVAGDSAPDGATRDASDAVPPDAAIAPDAPSNTCTPACGGNASCVMVGATYSCACNAGFSGDPLTGCTNTNECLLPSVCPGTAVCRDQIGSYECLLPASCEQLPQLYPAQPFVDGNYTLYVANNAGLNWTARCVGFGTAQVATYLEVTEAKNSSELRVATLTQGTRIVTTGYRALRVAPGAGNTLVVDTSDQSFVTNSGSAMVLGAGTVTSMPYGVAMSCVAFGDKSATAELDLTTTRFRFVPGSFSSGGIGAGASTFTFSANNQKVKLSGGGICGWMAPNNSPVNPVNNRGTLLTITTQ